MCRIRWPPKTTKFHLHIRDTLRPTVKSDSIISPLLLWLCDASHTLFENGSGMTRHSSSFNSNQHTDLPGHTLEDALQKISCPTQRPPLRTTPNCSVYRHLLHTPTFSELSPVPLISRQYRPRRFHFSLHAPRRSAIRRRRWPHLRPSKGPWAMEGTQRTSIRQ